VRVLGWLLDVLTGRILHWTSTHNVVVTEIWNRIGSLSEPQRTILKGYHVAAGIVVEALIGPGNKAKTVGLHVNLKEISLEQFRDLYDALLTYFVVLSSKSNPEGGKTLIDALKKVVSNQRLSRELIVSLGVTGEIDMERLGEKVWDQIVSILGAGDRLHLGQRISFSLIAAQAYVEAGKGYFSNKR